MITSALITRLRRKFSDMPIKHQDIRTGDGSSTVYRTQFYPIKESSFAYYKANALQAASGYTIDLDTGDFDIQAANSVEIKAQYKSVNFRDQHWLEAIQGAFESLGDQYFRTVIRSTSGIQLSANIQVYSAPASCIRLTEILESDDYTLSGNWVQPAINLRYDRRSNKLILGSKPSKANYVNISYLRKLTIPSAVSMSLDVEDNWIGSIEAKAGSDYFRSMAARIAQQGNATVEEGHLSYSQLRQLANDHELMFENLKRKNKPIMPAIVIPYYIHGGGNA